jgi:hypothetical protein
VLDTLQLGELYRGWSYIPSPVNSRVGESTGGIGVKPLSS